MKVVFLDIDGVVNTLQIGEDLTPYYCTELDSEVGNKQAVRWLNKLCAETGASIVITSDWRYSGLGVCRFCLYTSGLKQDIQIIDATPTHSGDIRSEEIKAWLREHPEVDKFVVLDDENIDDLSDRIVKCDPDKGFLSKEYKLALDLLSD